MASSERLFQLIQAKATHNTLQASASEMATYPDEPEKISAAGLKISAPTSHAIVIVYRVPVDFCWESNIATSSVVGCVPERKEQIAKLSSDDPRRVVLP
jgi:hypothetical protein